MVEKIALFETGNENILWQKMAQEAIDSCPKIKKDREKEILADRFGVEGKPKTLQAIGDKYHITRERVRQIVNNTLQKIKKNCTSPEIKRLLKEIELAVQENGGYASAKSLSSIFTDGSENEKNGFNLIVSLSDSLEEVKTSNLFNDGWRRKNIKAGELKSLSLEATKILRENGRVMKTDEIAKIMDKDTKLTQAALSANKNLMRDEQGSWGLGKWPHLNPRSIKDKSKYIMIRHGKPIHYGDLAERISDLGSKNVTKQSVHNELIKNTEFVLVGRGIYALAEWGYQPGIVEEVIVAVLREAGEPLQKEIIIERVLERRIVKPSTITLNLQRPRFKKLGKAVYTLN
jgi:hypothetical protein